MKLTVTDLMVLIDTLNGSLEIKDASSYIFHYHEDYRKDLSFKMQVFLNTIKLDIETEENIGN
jgi:hypothetical protein